MNTSDKKFAQQVHFGRRLKERYGIECTEAVRAYIIHQIRYQKAEKIKWQSWRVRIYGVQVDGQRIIVAYDKERKELITALPLNETEVTDASS